MYISLLLHYHMLRTPRYLWLFLKLLQLQFLLSNTQYDIHKWRTTPLRVFYLADQCVQIFRKGVSILRLQVGINTVEKVLECASQSWLPIVTLLLNNAVHHLIVITWQRQHQRQ